MRKRLRDPKIRQSAYKMWLFAIMLPLYVTLYKSDSKVWPFDIFLDYATRGQVEYPEASCKPWKLKNICYIVAKRSQHALCYHLNCDEPFLGRKCVASSTSSDILFDDEPIDIRTFFHTQSFHIPIFVK